MSEPTPNREALERTLAELGERLTEEHAALVEAARSMADAVDAGEFCRGLPGESCGARVHSPAAMWKEYRAAVRDLMEVESGVDDESAGFLRAVQAPVGDRKVS